MNRQPLPRPNRRGQEFSFKSRIFLPFRLAGA
jgi:hypothetical protein